MDLSEFSNDDFRPGAALLKRIAWYLCNAWLFHSWFVPLSAPKRQLLRWFGAGVGAGVVIKPRVNIKYPWRLHIGDHSWVGEGVWIDNLDDVRIGANVCISQGSCLLTGNHDYRSKTFALATAPIVIEDQAWVGAFSIICPGALVRFGTVLAVGSVLRQRSTDPNWVYGGSPAERLRPRYGAAVEAVTAERARACEDEER